MPTHYSKLLKSVFVQTKSPWTPKACVCLRIKVRIVAEDLISLRIVHKWLQINIRENTDAVFFFEQVHSISIYFRFLMNKCMSNVSVFTLG